MARITVREANGTREVTVHGRLIGAEVRRLEQACGPALERAHIGLHLRLVQVTAIDEVARALIGRLVERGGTLTIHSSLPDGAIGDISSS
jgi:hypothetical protein